MRLENLKKALEVFRDAVVQQAKLNLKGQNKVSSGNLYNSIKGSEVKVSDNSIQFNIEMEDYGTFIDKGVNGKKSAYTTPYSYKDKMPPPSKLDKWIVKKGIAPRGENGKFIDRKSLQFAIAKSIFNNGIKPSLFFTKPFEEQYKKLEGQLDDILFRDAEEMIQFIAKQNFKKK
jgi:hypothetical protein